MVSERFPTLTKNKSSNVKWTFLFKDFNGQMSETITTQVEDFCHLSDDFLFFKVFEGWLRTALVDNL